MYKALPTSTESPEDRRHRFRAEKDAPLRPRLHARSLRTTGQAPSGLQGAERLAVPRPPGRAGLAPYARGGLRARFTLKQPPGTPRALSAAVRTTGQARGQEPRGVGSEGERPQYLAPAPPLQLAYSTGPRLVRSRLQATPQAPRRAPPPPPAAVAQFQAPLAPPLLSLGRTAQPQGSPRWRVWGQEERRGGRRPLVRPRLPARGGQPILSAAYRFEGL